MCRASFLKHLFLRGALLMLLGCMEAPVELSRVLSVEAAAVGELCLDAPELRERHSRVLFVVDKSGSNAEHDPNDMVRANNIQRFLDEHGDTPLQKYGFISFGVNSGSQAYINDGSDGSPVFGDKADLQAALERHRSTADNGCTPYLSALNMTRAAIEKDMILNEDKDITYNVFFLSDGFPTDANGECSNVVHVIQDSPTDLYASAVRNIVSLAPNKIFFSTAYYTPPEFDPTRGAAQGLKYLAKYGQGQFTDLNGGTELEFNQLRLGLAPEAWILKRMVAVNLNMAFCSNGEMGADSDADGLCDQDEINFNGYFADKLDGKKFDPVNRYSLSSSYSDFFAYKFSVLPTGEGLDNCTVTEGDLDHDFLNSCEESILFDSQPTGPTNQWSDELRRLEGGSASRHNPDSDGDGFLDSLEYFQFGVKSAAVNFGNIFHRYSLGVTGESLMSQRLHPMNPKETKNATDFQVDYNGINLEGQHCYRLRLNAMPFASTKAFTHERAGDFPALAHAADENVILIYYITTPERDPNGRGYLMHKTQTVTREQLIKMPSLYQNFKAYKVPELESD